MAPAAGFEPARAVKPDGFQGRCVTITLSWHMADGEGFEPSHDFKPSNHLAGGPLHHLGIRPSRGERLLPSF